jgi:hypothetical protein
MRSCRRCLRMVACLGWGVLAGCASGAAGEPPWPFEPKEPRRDASAQGASEPTRDASAMGVTKPTRDASAMGASESTQDASAMGVSEPTRDASTVGMSEPTRDASAVDAGSTEPTFEGEGQPFRDTAPRARCGGDDKPDGTLQGLNGDFRCNLELLGELPAPHFLSLAWYGDCAYVNGPDATSVIHVAADGKPSLATTLTELGFRSNWESMKASERSGLLAGYESNGATLTVYDVSQDCKAPVLQSSIRLEALLLGSLGHAGSFSPDGTIYYASSMYLAEVFAVDLRTPKQPQVINAAFERSAHDLFIGKQGKRGYFAYPTLTALGVGSFAVMDLSEVEARAPNAKGKLIHEQKWEDGNVSQYPTLLSYRGRDHLLITDELGSGNCDNPEKPQWGYARIFDISNEKSPQLVSLIKTEAQDPKNCMAAGQANGGTSGFGLGTHYCSVDRLDDPRLLSCGEWDAGVRVFDIRNPWRPKEVAYFDTPTANVPGLTRIHAAKRELWVATAPGTFYVLKFTPGSAADLILSE